ncbi:ABC transporter ATP-binding protein [Falsirhodobacter deserti]|uniref:ABC transporter ATP-binding protein n=1 Tax=Falsirhodobacter deserti TaxID=1365611 RepID=UPI000FE3FB76|nr:ABC transporter ATP-binding protein [Falsirhodobacter deserti]
MPIIELDHLAKRFGQTPVVNDVSLRIEEGEFMCILGPSGCGKTTMLRMIAGLETSTGGRITIRGQVVDGVQEGRFVPPEKRGIGLVFQSYALWPHMTVERNIEFGLRLRKMDRAARRARVNEVMAMLRIDGLGARYPSQLSGGQQQRVALARMLAVNPRVLLLDEPLSNLDAALRLRMREELSRLHRDFGTTIVFVTHDQWEAMTLSTRIAVMNGGQLQQVGTPDQIYGQPANRFVAEFIGNPPINMIATGTALADAILAAGGLSDIRQAVAVGLRPEGVMLSRTPTPGAIPVDLRAVLPTGGSWILDLGHPAEGGQLFHVTHVPPGWQAGQRLYALPRPEALHLFDACGGRIPCPPARSLQPALVQETIR